MDDPSDPLGSVVVLSELPPESDVPLSLVEGSDELDDSPDVLLDVLLELSLDVLLLSPLEDVPA